MKVNALFLKITPPAKITFKICTGLLLSLFSLLDLGAAAQQTIQIREATPSALEKAAPTALPDLDQVGIVSREPIEPRSELYERIVKFNFDDFRKMNVRSLVKVIEGPILELYSILEMQEMGTILDPEVVKSKAARQDSEAVNQTMPLVYVGFNKNRGSYPDEMENQLKGNQR